MSRKEFIIVLIITFIVFLIWVAADISHSKSQVNIDPSLEELAKPLNPNFDISIIDSLSK